MKKTLLLLSIFNFILTQAQIVNIPDANFKYALLNHTPVIDTNSDGEIQISEAENFAGSLSVTSKSISNLTGIEAFINITLLNCKNNQLTTLDLTDNVSLVKLYCAYNQLTSLNINYCTNLTLLHCYKNELVSLYTGNNVYLSKLNCRNNLLTVLNLSNNNLLTGLTCHSNQLTALDVSHNTDLDYLRCDGNPIGSLDVSQNTALTRLFCIATQLTALNVSSNVNLNKLDCSGNQIATLDVINNVDLVKLFCSGNQLTNLNVNANTALEYLFCENNQLTDLDLGNNTALISLGCSSTQLTNLDVSDNTVLTHLTCGNSLLTTLDVSNNPALTYLSCFDNPNLTYINLKNGNNDGLNIYFSNLPNLESVCVDDINEDLVDLINNQVAHAVTYTEYCSLTPAQSNQILGAITVDLDVNGCDSSDAIAPNLLVLSDNGTESFGTFSQADGTYLTYTDEGDFTTIIQTALPSYYTISPASQANTFTGYNNIYTADFCVAPNATVNDVNVTVIPLGEARPGFDSSYRIVYKNVGTTQLNGSVVLTYDNTNLSYVSASETVTSETGTTKTFSYTDLNPLETRIIDLVFTTSATTNIGDTLTFEAAINPTAGDNTVDDNTFVLNQTVIGSYDPNDITCLEGAEVLYTDVDKYLHYVIRFQNTGTADAINVVVANDLDAKLDWSTFQLETASHDNRVAIKNGHDVEFIFENIHLPDSTANEVASHGFIAYKIKPKNTVALNDVIPNKADIFFDYNAAVETNIANTTYVATLVVREENSLDFSIYPTPTKDILHIHANATISKIALYNNLGQLVLKKNDSEEINIATLKHGFYFVKVQDENGSVGIKKVVKE